MKRDWMWVVSLAALAGVSVANEAEGQRGRGGRLNVSAPPNYGARQLAPGFTPDPVTVDLVSGGGLDVNRMNLGPDCRGFATAAPDYNFTLTAASAFLRVFVEAGEDDTTLIINRPDGSWVCADDTYGQDPGIDLRNAQPGLYNIWVGSYQAATRARGRLSITELERVRPGARGRRAAAPAPARLDVSATPNFGARRLSPGFTPDPANVAITSGGALDVNAMNLGPNCRGFATAAPDYNFTLTGRSAFLRLFVDAGNQDTTLIINRPDGSWICNDDTYGRNPGIDLRNAQPGVYNVWVGSYEASTQARGTLSITELESVRPRGGQRR